MSALVGTLETAASPPIQVTIASGTTNTVTLSWLPIPGASAYNLYGRTVGNEQFLAQVTAPTTLWVDTGAITPSGAFLTVSQFAESTATPGLYAVPAGVKAVTIRSVTISNPTNTTGQVFLSRVPVGLVGATTNRIIGGAVCLPDAAGGGIRLSQLVILAGTGSAPGDFLTGYATIPGVVLNVDGLVTA